MLECRRPRKLMREWMAGTLDASGREALERHAAACPACREEWRGLQEIVMGTERRLKPDPGSEYWDGYWEPSPGARMAAEDERAPVGRRPPCRPARVR